MYCQLKHVPHSPRINSFIFLCTHFKDHILTTSIIIHASPKQCYMLQ
uniref:Uncharacterized protein n=1 Tax=Anguilla anguilla TaxID=7936 RepID=A0A0E9TPP4_ANGAN